MTDGSGVHHGEYGFEIGRPSGQINCSDGGFLFGQSV